MPPHTLICAPSPLPIIIFKLTGIESKRVSLHTPVLTGAPRVGDTEVRPPSCKNAYDQQGSYMRADSVTKWCYYPCILTQTNVMPRVAYIEVRPPL